METARDDGLKGARWRICLTVFALFPDSRTNSRAVSGPGRPALGAAFVAAASPRLRPGEGCLALVLPATVCTGPSWRQTRDLIQRDFALDMVITSHDPRRWNFSDSTDLSEALLITTRRPPRHSDPICHSEVPRGIPSSSPHRHTPPSGANSLKTLDHEHRYSAEPRTTFVNLRRNPVTVLGAHRLARAVSTATPARLEDTGTALLDVDGEHVGEVVSLPESKLVGTQWTGVQFARADLLRSALRLLDEGQIWIPGEANAAPVPLCRVDELGQVGPDRRRLVDGFDRKKSVTAYPLVAGHDTEQRISLTCSPDSYLSPLPIPRGGQRPGYGQHLWRQASRLLVAERLRLTTARIVAMRSDTNVLSNVWWPIRVDDASIEKVLALWLNSSLGLLTIVAQRTSTEGGWVALKKADLRKLPVLDARRLSPTQRQDLSHLFDQLTDAEFQRLPTLPHDPARQTLDHGLSQILNLPTLTTLRHLLATEPTISNHRL